MTGNHRQPSILLRGGELRHGFDAIFGIHMYRAHEPARFIRTDRQDCQLERPTALADRAEFRMERSIAGEKNRVLSGSQRPSAPQSPIAAAESPAGKVLRRNA